MLSKYTKIKLETICVTSLKLFHQLKKYATNFPSSYSMIKKVSIILYQLTKFNFLVASTSWNIFAGWQTVTL